MAAVKVPRFPVHHVGTLMPVKPGVSSRRSQHSTVLRLRLCQLAVNLFQC